MSRILGVAALAVAVAALVISVLALRDAHHANDGVARVEEEIPASRYQNPSGLLYAARSARQVKRLAPSLSFAIGLCYGARHLTLPARRNYATNVGIAIVRQIAASCNYAHVPKR